MARIISLNLRKIYLTLSFYRVIIYSSSGNAVIIKKEDIKQ